MQYIDQRLTESQKRANDYAKAKEVANYLIPAFHNSSNWIDEFKRDLGNYRLVNNVIEKDELEKICNPLDIPASFFEDDILPYNKVPAKLNLLLGEELKRNESYAMALLDDSSILSKDAQISEMFYEYAENELRKEMMKIMMENQGASEEEIQREVEKLEARYDLEDIENFKSEQEIFAHSVIKYANFACNLKEKKNTGFKHAAITDKEVIYVGMINGMPAIEPVNVLHFFAQKGPEVENYQDGDWAGRRMVMTLNQVSRIFGNSMKKKDYKKLREKSFKYGGQEFSVKNQQMYPEYYKSAFSRVHSGLYHDAFIYENIGQYGDGTSTTYFEEDLIWVTHLTWKWERKVGFLTAYDQFGDADTTIVDSEYKIPDEHEKVEFVNKWGMNSVKKVWYEEGLKREIEHLYIPRVWECYRVDQDIFPIIRELPHQPISVSNPFDVQLPYIGKQYSAMNAEGVSPVARMKPFNALYMVVMHQFVKMIARNYGAVLKLDATQIDLGLGKGDPQIALEETLRYLREGIFIYNSMRDAETGSDVPQQRSAANVESYSNLQDIVNMTQVLAFLDREIGMGFGITPEREGNFQAYSNVTDNQQGIVNSSNMTELYFFRHNIIWKDVLNYYVNMFRLWAKDQFLRNPDMDKLVLNYVLPNGNPASFMVTPDMVTNGDIGLFVTNYGSAASYFDKMEQLALTFIQNERASLKDISMLIKARIDGTSPEQVHKMIVDLEKKKDEMDERMQQANSESVADRYKQEVEFETLKHQHKLEEIRLEKSLDGQNKLEVEVIKNENQKESNAEG